ncbi:MAG: Eco57I restriction-modification methylase domain-containing protein [Bacteroidetes bacterium]|nr:Eco57I restriction-modification methylase domain-containing protein [Bacteroidota bacterium]
MAITKSDFSAYIKAFQFRELFNEMGWNNDRTKQPIIVDEAAYILTGIAEKSGFRIFACEPPTGNKLPDSATRKKIEGKVTKLYQEHLIIFTDDIKKEQIWQLAVRKAGSPTKISETRYTITHNPELLYQRASGLFFTLDEEGKITIIDVTTRVAENFQQNNEKVTKKFYESFKKQHTSFLNFIKGIDNKMSIDWYASLMLDRLMFCYFIQKKGFLDNNKNYLRDKLKACKEKKGKNKFYSFYRDFLLALFHKGLGAPQHDKKFEVEIGNIPYLNGGLFDEHEIEKTFTNIQIDDQAFETLFNFFDEYEWHLDTRTAATGRDINPDVIGYIFEKYINDRAQMGAYYTKEDITDYISKNCIIPWLFDEAKRNYPKAFADDGWLRSMIKNSGDEYIYNAVKHGIPEGNLFGDLPEEIQKGFVPELGKKIVDGKSPWLWELRKSWNKPAPSEIALPTEIYREVIERRKRYMDTKTKIENGEICEINDFITYNLNIRQFVQDVIETTADADFIKHFYKALSSVTILDPTCGSGAFLFAAMNILELLYEACIHRMNGFVSEAAKGKYKFFEDTLKQVNAPEHPNLQYFIYKSIILNNLYGVDIMNEAVEIAKLRLFLKLVATVDADYRKPNLGLEPLPDVDFNIRAGNTLVGYATEAQLKDAFIGKLDFDNDADKIKEKCDIVARAFAHYKETQLKGYSDFNDFKKAKDVLNERLDKLRNELDILLHKQYYSSSKYDQWSATHQPFHWFAEFYEIINGRGGFDVVIGNPPYVEYSNVKKDYSIVGYETEGCGNLYAFIMERAIFLCKLSSYNGLIVPISLPSTPRMAKLREFLQKNNSLLYCANFADRPGTLFSGVHQKVSVLISVKGASKDIIFSTNFLHWYSNENNNERKFLFDKVSYSRITKINDCNAWLKNGTAIENAIWQKKSNKKNAISYFFQESSMFTFFLNMRLMFWTKCFLSPKKSKEFKIYKTSKEIDRNALMAILNSNLHFYYWETLSDCWHITQRELNFFKIDYQEIKDNTKIAISDIGLKLEADLESKKKYVGTVQIDYEYYHKLSKPIIDQIDCLLAQHYGFTHEELDFIINYNIKYRMGKELNSGEEDEVNEG